MQAQRATLKYLDGKRKIESSIPNRESGLGKVNAMNTKLKTEGSISLMESGKVSNAAHYLLTVIFAFY